MIFADVCASLVRPEAQLTHQIPGIFAAANLLGASSKTACASGRIKFLAEHCPTPACMEQRWLGNTHSSDPKPTVQANVSAHSVLGTDGNERVQVIGQDERYISPGLGRLLETSASIKEGVAVDVGYPWRDDALCAPKLVDAAPPASQVVDAADIAPLPELPKGLRALATKFNGGQSGPSEVPPPLEDLYSSTDDQKPDDDNWLPRRELLPSHWFNIEFSSIPAASFMHLAHSWQNNLGAWGPEFPEDVRVRALITQANPPIFLLELNSVATFNMMDTELGTDNTYCMDCCRYLLGKPGLVKRAPVAYTLQGVGPHFCPGGNHHPNTPVGSTVFTMSTYISFYSFSLTRELHIPGVVACTGSLVGGGVAYSLNQTLRVAAHSASFSFGNISRGACPGMFLSKNLPSRLGRLGALDLYLTDNTYSPAGALRHVAMISGIARSIQDAKHRSYMMAKRVAAVPDMRLAVQLTPPFSFDHYAWESFGMWVSGKTGMMFGNIKKAASSSTQAEEEPGNAPGDPHQKKGNGDETMLPPMRAHPSHKFSAAKRRDMSKNVQGVVLEHENTSAVELLSHFFDSMSPSEAVVESSQVYAVCSVCGESGESGEDMTQHESVSYCLACWRLSGLEASQQHAYIWNQSQHTVDDLDVEEVTTDTLGISQQASVWESPSSIRVGVECAGCGYTCESGTVFDSKTYCNWCTQYGEWVGHTTWWEDEIHASQEATLSGLAASCTMCGDRDVQGLKHGGVLYCQLCYARMGFSS